MATHKKLNPRPSFVPEDMIYSILLWLPVKALLRLKSVCKSWLSLISSRDFIKTQLSKSTKDPNFTRHHLLIGHRGYEEQMDYLTCSVYSLLNEPVAKTIKLDNIGGTGITQYVVGYCHGLVCLKSHDNYISLWNPSTRESRKLPKVLDIIREPKYGFGYDEFNDEFKVFAIWGYKVSVYTSKSDCWRMIGDYPFDRGVGPSFWGVSLTNGAAIHWVAAPDILPPDLLSEELFIVSLDVKTETYRKVLLPKSGGEITKQAWFWTFGKSLAVLCNLQNKDVVDIWVIEDSGVEEDGWKKLFTIPRTNLLTEFSSLKPVCIYETDSIMLRSDTTIMLYNSRDKTFKYPLHLSFEDHQDFYLDTYVESLVSPSLQTTLF